MNSYTVNQRMELVSKYMNGNYKSQRHFCEEESIANSTFSGWIKSYNENKLQPVSDDNRRVRLRKKSTGEFDPNLIDYKRPKLNVRLIPMMAIDFIESSTSYVIRAEVAGVAEEGIDISIEKDILRIRATKKEIIDAEGYTRTHQECSYGTEYRTIKIPLDSNKESLSRIYENGTLIITLPKHYSMDHQQTHRFSIV